MDKVNQAMGNFHQLVKSDSELRKHLRKGRRGRRLKNASVLDIINEEDAALNLKEPTQTGQNEK